MSNIIYNRPESRKKYISISKHQKNARNNHSKWKSINIERDLFDYADYGNFEKQEGFDSWICSSGNMWALQEDRSSVGTDKQQFGFFQAPSNDNGEWHGFPIIPFSESRYNISTNLLERWIREGVISEDDIPNIKKRRRI